MGKKLQYLVIHCTATPEGREVTEQDIRDWHLSPAPKGRGWKQVGYTNLFQLTGINRQLVTNNMDDVVDTWEITNGVAGINDISYHIVYAGGCDKNMKPKDTRTDAQKTAMANFVKKFVCTHFDVKVAGHYQFDNKACPSFNVPEWLRSIGIHEKNIYKG